MVPKISIVTPGSKISLKTDQCRQRSSPRGVLAQCFLRQKREQPEVSTHSTSLLGTARRRRELLLPRSPRSRAQGAAPVLLIPAASPSAGKGPQGDGDGTALTAWIYPACSSGRVVCRAAEGRSCFPGSSPALAVEFGSAKFLWSGST